MSRSGPIGGGGRRHKWRRGGVPVRPLKWISGASETDPEAADPCRVKISPVACFDGDGGVPSAHEIVAGRSDLIEMDRNESTMVRIVGQISLDYSQIFYNQLPSFQIPFVRLALVANEGDVSPATWVPPDLWSRADLEEVPFMWLHQSNFAKGFAITAFGTLNLGPDLNSVIQLRDEIDVDCRINRKIGRDGSIFLVAQTHYTGPVGLGVNAPLVAMIQNLRILSKN